MTELAALSIETTGLFSSRKAGTPPREYTMAYPENEYNRREREIFIQQRCLFKLYRVDVTRMKYVYGASVE